MEVDFVDDSLDALLQLEPLLGILGELDREIISLRFGAATPYRLIGEILGLSEDNVAQRLRRALDKMRKLHAQRARLGWSDEETT